MIATIHGSLHTLLVVLAVVAFVLALLSFHRSNLEAGVGLVVLGVVLLIFG